MTDNIIHEVFSEPDNTFAKQIMYNFDANYTNMILDYYRQSLNRKEQKLIEKIQTKQFRISYKISDKVIKLKDLIGDNQE